MPTIGNDEVEAEARAILRDQLMRSLWFPERLRRQKDLCQAMIQEGRHGR